MGTELNQNYSLLINKNSLCHNKEQSYEKFDCRLKYSYLQKRVHAFLYV